jgi:hypothetical protein
MPDWNAVHPEHVLDAISECDSVGADEFFAKHDFGPARSYVLRHEGSDYDATAILGAALGCATGHEPSADDFAGGKAGAAEKLRDLGFEVTGRGGEDGEPATAADESTKERWALEARDLLIRTARSYQAVTTTRELAAYVQAESGVSTTRMTHSWIGDVLARVARDCASRGEPNLAAFCVNAQGSVGDDYASTVVAAGGTRPDDPDAHAAEERFAGHRHFGADLPAGGGFSSLTPQLATSRARARKVRIEAQTPALCPVHHIAVPPSGVCDYCD